MEQWREIEEFDHYLVSDQGNVASTEDHNAMLKQTLNQQGIPSVGLRSTGDHKTYRRAVARLVANAFLPPPHEDHFDTPINLNGDRLDNRAVNLEWRPRWYAIKYHKQFEQEGFHKANMRIKELTSGRIFESPAEAAVEFGLCYTDVILSAVNETYAILTFHNFRQVK